MSSARNVIVAMSVAGAAASAVESPLAKVVTLIKEMKTQVESEAKEDEAAYSKYECWCKTNDGEKTAAIDDANNRLEELGSFVETAAAKEGELKTNIESLTGDIAEDKDSLASADAIRQKENGEFLVAEKDMKETLDALGNALSVLEKAQLLQKKKGAVDTDAVKAALLQVQDAVTKHSPKYKDVMEKDLFDVLGTFGAKGFFLPRAALDQEPTGAAAGAKSYNSRSGGIFGILSEMKDEFTRDLANAQKGEAAADASFQKLREAKEGEIAAGTEQKKADEALLADTMNKAAKAKKDISKTQEALSADEQFLMNLKKNCAKEQQNYDDRVAVRTNEVTALAETLKILTDDDARELMGKTMSLVQMQDGTDRHASSGSTISTEQAAARDRASKKAMLALSAVAKKQGNWALASLAVRVRLDAFSKVKETMDKMLTELKVQQQDEVDKKELCDKQIDEAEDAVKVGEQKQDDLNMDHKQVTNDISRLTSDIEKLKTDVEDNQIALKQAGENRKEENMVFKQSIADQRATIEILNKAYARLQDFYSPKLVQIRAHAPGRASSEAPPAPKDYEKSDSAGGVLQMISKIISDTKSAEAEMEVSEQNAQEEYASLVKDTAASLEADRVAIAEKEAASADASGTKSETQESQLSNDAELQKSKDLLSAHHTNCDWIRKYFDLRQQARQEEMDSIQNAMAILSGANFGF